LNRASSSIVVTGVGLVTPLGASRDVTWRRVLAGETGIQVSPRGLEARIHDFSPNGARSRLGDFALLAAREALAQAGLAADAKGMRIGCAVSQSKPILQSLRPMPESPAELSFRPVVTRTHSKRSDVISSEDNDRGLDASLLLSNFFGWSPPQVLMRDLQLAGPSLNVVAACATGVASIAVGEQWLKQGLCDAVLVGAAESSLNDFYRAGFRQMGVLADDASGAAAARPFDRDRSGFVMGEGAAVLLLERADTARARGAAPLARLARTVLRQSVGDVLRFDEDGALVAALVRHACAETAGPDYINAHGTGTRLNDAVEARGLRQALGGRARSTPISSTKAATGHLLGAAGALEAALTVLALRDQRVPPTLNLDNPESDLDFVAKRSRPGGLFSALSLSYGFGGQMGAVLFNAC
jgi:3-oxoacyl-[acyl-carrier-protein] synthase II